MLNKIAPKKFLCKYSLSVGALIGGILFIVLAILCIICLIVQLLTAHTARCSDVIWVNAVSCTSTGILYHLLLILVDAWMMWGVSQKTSSILLAWVILSAMWVAQTFCVVVVIILLRRSVVGTGVWITYLALTVVFALILAYMVLVVFGLRLEIKEVRRSRRVEEVAHENL